ncbi:polysaccharide deacetylase family protein [Myxococcota bacterium]|nr:polysaccharide deacetylase family protein [Myxococcota bacterium]
MQGKRELLSTALQRAGLLGLAARLRRDLVVVLGWHRIRPDGPPRAQPFADDVFGPTVSELDAALAWLKANVAILSEPELVHLVERGKSPRRPSVVITFDDGYSDNHHLALPVLRAHGVPATFFVPTRRIDERALDWVDLVPWALKTTLRAEITFDGATYALPRDRARAIQDVHRRMQREPATKTRDLVPRLFDVCAVDPPPRERQSAEIMTWAELKDAAAHGITIGSHTHGHRVLATLDPAEQREELATSKALLEHHLGQPIRTLAYPVGGYRHFTHETRRLARDVGYALACSFCTGVNHTPGITPFDVRRTSPPPSLALLAGTTLLPELFDWSTPSAEVRAPC